MNPNILPSDRVRIMGTIDPDAYSSGSSYSSDWVDASKFANFLSMVLVGEMDATGTVDAKLEQATDSGGSGAKNISGKSITQLTAAGTDDDKQALINLRPDELDIDNNFTHFRLTITVGTADSDAAGVVVGLDARYEPETDLASVDEIVS